MTALSAADCPLLTTHGGPTAGSLIERFNAVAADVQEVVADPKLTGLTTSPQFRAAVTDRLARVREEVTRRRYAVGFIGLTQAGKSTTVNNLLGEEVCKQGAMDATSSQPLRLTRAAGRSLDIEYLDPTRLAARRQKLLAAVGLDPSADEADVAAAVAEPGRLGEATSNPRARDDLAFLRDFLRASRTLAGQITAPPRVVAGLPFSRLNEFTTHGGQGGDDRLLVREVRGHLDCPQLPADLELCDLPGLGSKRSVDDIITEEYLPDLHGTFLFVNGADNLLNSNVLRTLRMVTTAFGSGLAGRAWLIFTKMDALARHVFDPKADNVFANITQVLEKVGVPPSQVCFCSNELAAELRERATLPPADRLRHVVERLKQTTDKPVPDGCPAGLRAAWEALAADGGIGRIRELMTEEVGRTLAGQIRKDSTAALDAVERELAARVDQEKARLAGGTQLVEQVNTCLGVVIDLLDQLARGPTPVLTQEGEHLRATLRRRFDDPTTRRVVAHLSAADLAKQFRLHARELADTVRQHVRAGLVDRVFDHVGQQLTPLPPLPLKASTEGCEAAWQQFRVADRTGDGWLPDPAGPAVDEFADWLAASDPMGADDYLGVMREKAGRVVCQTVYAVQARVRARLTELKDDLMGLTYR